MRLAAPIAIVALAAALLGGCGSSEEGSGTDSGATPRDGAPAAPIGAAAHSCESEAVDAERLRATGVSCAQARRLVSGWQRDSHCAAGGGSHSACTTSSYRCVATRTGRGLAVSCARPGRSIAFTARPR